MNGYSLVFIPRSWALGVWYRPKKIIYAFGPFRFAVHYGLGPWKPKDPPKAFKGTATWLKGTSPSERLTRADGGPSNVLAGGTMEPRTPPKGI